LGIYKIPQKNAFNTRYATFITTLNSKLQCYIKFSGWFLTFKYTNNTPDDVPIYHASMPWVSEAPIFLGSDD